MERLMRLAPACRSPDDSGGTTADTAAATADRELRTRWIVGMVVALVVGGLVPIAIALIDRGPGSEPPAQTTAPSVTAPSVGPTAGASSASALTGPSSPMSPVSSQSSASLTSPVYLTDLDYSTADDDNYVEVGLASIAGKRYKNLSGWLSV
jgi:hypothetical protein